MRLEGGKTRIGSTGIPRPSAVASCPLRVEETAATTLRTHSAPSGNARRDGAEVSTRRSRWPRSRAAEGPNNETQGADVLPKSDGGRRLLGIPTVTDRVVQQAIAQVLTPIFDPTFSDSSFGFRPGRNVHQAIGQMQASVKEARPRR